MSIRGICTSRGVAIGSIRIYRPYHAVIEETHISPEEAPAEMERFHAAQAAARRELERIISRTPDSSHESKAILSAHVEMTQDVAMQEAVEQLIVEELHNACWSIHFVFTKFARRLSLSKDPVLRERAADMADVCGRLIRNCCGQAACDLSALAEPVLLAAEDLLPSDTAAMDVSHVLGIITEAGGYASHSAIIARSHGIPAISGVENLLQTVPDGALAILDATEGKLLLHPAEETLISYREIAKRDAAQRHAEAAFRDSPAQTSDGVPVSIGLNLGSDAPAELLGRDFTDYVGLFRSEFLYMGKNHFPTEEEQISAYQNVLRAYGDRPVILRTLDIGGDKTLPYFQLPQEQNPSLGNRALRFCLSHEEIFRTQLRAALRAAVIGNLWLMLPMVGSMDDIDRAMALIDSVRRELAAEGVPFPAHTPVGVMIEIPSIAMIADTVAREVDFASIGSNDLCQYLLAADRLNPAVQPYYQTYHPAMFRLMGYAAKAFGAAGKPIGICGEIGGDPLAAPALVGLGFRKLSMNAGAVSAVKRAIAGHTVSSAEALADAVQRCRTAEEAAALLKNAGAKAQTRQ